MTSPKGKEVASVKFTAIKNNKQWFYEMKLLCFKATYQYCVLRRWYYEDEEEHTRWTHTGWSSNGDEKYQHKLVQKRDIMKYQIVSQVDNKQQKQN